MRLSPRTPTVSAPLRVSTPSLAALLCLLPTLCGSAPAAAQTFSYTQRIDVIDATFSGGITDPGLSNPYPAVITVPDTVTVNSFSNVRVTLNGLFTNSLNDLDFLVVAPSGASVRLLFGGGNPDNPTEIPQPGVNYTFQDDGVPFPTGTGVNTVPSSQVVYDPTVALERERDTFPRNGAFPPPPGPQTTPTPGAYGDSLLSAAQADPSGDWRLYVADFAADGAEGDPPQVLSGLLNGWSLEFTVIPEPGTLPLVGAAGAGLLLGVRVRRRRRRGANA